MIKLTREQEITILKRLMDREVAGEKILIDYGSSRVVFSLPGNAVVKVASSIEGQRQNEFEVNNFELLDTDYLAKIYAYGPSVIIMEKVDPVCINDGIMCEDDYDADSEDQPIEAYDAYFWANRNIGETEDNAQIGINADGKYVLYDYGFQSDSNIEQVGSSGDILENLDIISFLELIINMLDNSEVFPSAIIIRRWFDEEDFYEALDNHYKPTEKFYKIEEITTISEEERLYDILSISMMNVIETQAN